MQSDLTSTTPVTRRRRDRKAQLAGLAADLFRRHGYHAVGIGDIAAAAGITGPAVYRHFRSKQEILAHVLLTGVDALAERISEILDQPGEPRQRLADLTDALARLAVDRRDAVALWRWLGRHLDREQQQEVRQRGDAAIARWAGELRQLRTDLSPPDAELLCLAAMGVYGSPADYTVTLGKERHARLLRRIAGAVLAAPLPRADPGTAAPARAPGALGSRREVLLTEATRLFRQRGYRAVSMEDIGAAAGIAGPSIYRHFASKAGLMRAAANRMVDRLSLDAARATAGAATPVEALRRLVDSYAETVLAHRDLMAVYVAELASLPAEDRADLQRLQRGYVAEWVRLISAANPDLHPGQARVVAHATLTVGHDLARTGRVQSRPGLAAELASLMNAATSVVRPE